MPFYTSDSLAPKHVLAWNFKQMVACRGFDHVLVSQLCEKSNVACKDFSSYFKSKYDLVRWIYDFDFFHQVYVRQYSSEYAFLEDLIRYLEAEQPYYAALFDSQIDIIQSYMAKDLEEYLHLFRNSKNARSQALSCIHAIARSMLENREAGEIYACAVAALAEGSNQ